jgi:hypothetical protein
MGGCFGKKGEEAKNKSGDGIENGIKPMSATGGVIQGKKEYSFNQKKKLNPEDYTFSNLESQTLIKNPQ